MDQAVHSKKLKWSPLEDRDLEAAVNIYGTKNWKLVATMVPGRNGKQCRERWLGQICPTVKKEEWSYEEDQILIDCQVKCGNKWTVIANLIPGRSATSIKNRWNWLLRHQVVQAQKRVSPRQLEPQLNSEIVEKHSQSTTKKNWQYLSPININNEIFGTDFLRFQQTLNLLSS